MEWLIAALREPVVQLAQLAAAAFAVRLGLVARQHAAHVERELEADRAPVRRKRSSSSSKPRSRTRSRAASSPPAPSLNPPSAGNSDA